MKADRIHNLLQTAKVTSSGGVGSSMWIKLRIELTDGKEAEATLSTETTSVKTVDFGFMCVQLETHITAEEFKVLAYPVIDGHEIVELETVIYTEKLNTFSIQVIGADLKRMVAVAEGDVFYTLHPVDLAVNQEVCDRSNTGSDFIKFVNEEACRAYINKLWSK